MIWHIFRKDCRQLWLLALIVACGQMAHAALRVALGPFNEPRGLVTFADLFSAATLFGMCALIVAVVQEDPLPGASQDWLVRPIRRNDLLSAKLLFVVLVVQGPAFVSDIAHGLAAGLTVRDTVSAAVSRGAVMLLAFDVPVFGLAAITSTLVQVMSSVIGIWLTVMVGVFAAILARGAPPPFASNGIQWMTPAYWAIVACSAACVIIPLQYFRRATTRSRQVALGAVLAAPVLSAATWMTAFAVQENLSPNAPLAQPIRIAFDADGGAVSSSASGPSNRTLLIPIRVSGLPADSVLMNDRAEVRLGGPDDPVYRGKTTPALGYGNDFVVRTGGEHEVRTRQQVVLPEQVYQRLRNGTVRMEIDYSLTVFSLEATATIARTDRDQRMATFGRCSSQVDEDGDEIELACLRSGAAPTCVSATIESGTREPRSETQWSCAPDYSPYPLQLYPDATSRFAIGIKLPDVDRTGGRAGGPPLDDPVISINAFHPAAHFTRRLVVPEVRLIP